MKRNTIVAIIVLLLSLLFIYAAYNKLSVYSLFTEQLKDSPYTKNFAGILAWLIPAVEILIACLLLFYRTRLAGLYGSFFLMLAFTIYIYVLIHFSPHVPCGCGGIIAQLGWKGHLWFNAAFTLLAGVGICLLPAQKQSLRTK